MPGRSDHALKVDIANRVTQQLVLDMVNAALVDVKRGTIQGSTRKFEQLFGFAVVNSSIGARIDELTRPPLNLALTESGGLIRSQEALIGVRKDGSTFPIEVSVSDPCQLSDGSVVAAVLVLEKPQGSGCVKA